MPVLWNTVYCHW